MTIKNEKGELKKTIHHIIFEDGGIMNSIKDNSVDLIVTSPPYPMIQMWDSMFGKANNNIENHIKNDEGEKAFELMHLELNKVWFQINRVLKQGGIACINIGDATRSIGGSFRMYNNHSKIIQNFIDLGFHNLPNIIRRKQTNAPNKFMGSGVMPVGAYVTLEHEYVLIFRKGKKREFKSFEEKDNRQKSSFFFEERNMWFSDIWEGIKGTKQKLNKDSIRERSAAYPIELAYRLINMFSVYGDVVLDPFLGTGTTTIAAMIAGRNSYGLEIDNGFFETINESISGVKELSSIIIDKRINNHNDYINEKLSKGGTFKYINKKYNSPVVSGVEQQIEFYKIKGISTNNNTYEVNYSI